MPPLPSRQAEGSARPDRLLRFIKNQIGLNEMALKTTARRMAGGSGHEHIAYLWWEDGNGKSDVWTREQMVAYIDRNGDNSVWCPDRSPTKQGAWVHTNSNGRTRYVQTVADGRWTDNLLSLPER